MAFGKPRATSFFCLHGFPLIAVHRSHELLIPLFSLLYVQPLYPATEQSSLPELKRVIFAFGNQILLCFLPPCLSNPNSAVEIDNPC